MNELVTLLRKDFLLLINNPKDLSLHLLLSLMLSLMGAFGISTYILEPGIYPQLVLIFVIIIFILTGSILVSKTLDAEIEQGALNHYLIARINLGLVYFSKVLINFVSLFVGLVLSFVILSVLLSVSFLTHLLPLILIAILLVMAYSALSTLLGALTSFSRAQGLLLPLLLIPLVFPIFFAGLELSFDLILNHQLNLLGFWFPLLAFLNVLYLILGINLYPYALKQ